MIEGRARRPTAWGAGERVERKFGQSLPPGCSSTRPEAARHGRNSPVARQGLRKFAVSGKLSIAKSYASGKPDYADPPFQAGFCVMGLWSRGLAKIGTRTRPIPRAPRA